jgi:hypothetical protein
MIDRKRLMLRSSPKGQGRAEVSNQRNLSVMLAAFCNHLRALLAIRSLLSPLPDTQALFTELQTAYSYAKRGALQAHVSSYLLIWEIAYEREKAALCIGSLSDLIVQCSGR